MAYSMLRLSLAILEMRVHLLMSNACPRVHAGIGDAPVSRVGNL